MATTRREFLRNVSLASVGMAIGGADMMAKAAGMAAADTPKTPKGEKVK
ncbi:MAG: twin-arginine translocation signal domain-containing protein, partial [Muribaculaceae bacterium]|nr:twin-arginine translocation signal domain-containing protein [Muribaculaceae bacterium]